MNNVLYIQYAHERVSSFLSNVFEYFVIRLCFDFLAFDVFENPATLSIGQEVMRLHRTGGLFSAVEE